MVLPQMHTANAHTTFGTLIYFDLAFFGIWFQHFKLKINCQFCDLDRNNNAFIFTPLIYQVLLWKVRFIQGFFCSCGQSLEGNDRLFNVPIRDGNLKWASTGALKTVFTGTLKKIKFLAENLFLVRFGRFQKFSYKILRYEQCSNPFVSWTDTLGLARFVQVQSETLSNYFHQKLFKIV